jgi:hypothetical protein
MRNSVSIRMQTTTQMTTRIIVGFSFLVASITMAQQLGFSGTFHNQHEGTFVFYENGTVDHTFKLPFTDKGVAVRSSRGSGTAGVIETKEQTLRGTFQVVGGTKIKAAFEGSTKFDTILETYSPARGYENWVLVSFPARNGPIFVQNGRSLVNAFSGVVFKQAWYSR